MTRMPRRCCKPHGASLRGAELLWATSIASLLGLAASCDRPETAGPNRAASAAAHGTAGVDLGQGGAAYAERDLAVAPDFEAEADREITKDNYRDELEALEIEMDAAVPDRTAADAGEPPPDAAAAPDGGRRKRRPLPEPL